MGLSPSGKPQSPSPKPAHKWTPEPTDISGSLFDQDFDQFMESLDNLEPFDDLKDCSDNVDLFMDTMAHPPQMADALWELVKLKKGKSKALDQRARRINSHTIVVTLDERECPLCRDGHPASLSPKTH